MFSQIKNMRDAGYTSSLAFQDNASTTLDIASLEGERISSSDLANNKKLSLAEKCPLEIWRTVFDKGHLWKRDLLKLRLVCKILEKIANTGITYLNLSNSKYLERLLTIFNIKFILLINNFDLQAQDLVKIKPSTTVKYLHVNFNREINDENLPALLEKFPYLEKLQLSNSFSIEFNSVNKWPTLNNVKAISLSSNKNLIDKNLAVLLKKLPNLEELDLSGCEGLAFNSENEWLNLSGVKILKLSYHQYLTDEKLSIFLSNFPKLEVLALANCRKLKFKLVDKSQTSSDLQFMWPAVNHIKELDLADNDQVAEEDIFYFLGRFSKLEKLNLCNCFLVFKENMHQWPDLQNIKEVKFSQDEIPYGSWNIREKYPNLEITYCKFVT